MKSFAFAVALIATFGWARADEAFPVSDHAIGSFYACKDSGYCEDPETEFFSMPGCVAGMIPIMAEWIGQHEGFKLKTGNFECRPKAQVRV